MSSDLPGLCSQPSTQDIFLVPEFAHTWGRLRPRVLSQGTGSACAVTHDFPENLMQRAAYLNRTPSLPTNKRHIVIVGGGFGGLACARALAGAGVHVTLIDKVTTISSSRCCTRSLRPHCRPLTLPSQSDACSRQPKTSTSSWLRSRVSRRRAGIYSSSMEGIFRSISSSWRRVRVHISLIPDGLLALRPRNRFQTPGSSARGF